VFGSGDGADALRLATLEREVVNLTLRGPFTSTAALPTERYAAYIFTSLWEGMPTTLVNVAALGIPIIASNVGGISELVNDDTGWLIREIDDPGAYMAALNEIEQRPQEAVRRVDAMIEHVRKRHSWDAYTEAFRVQPSFLS
jgi:glycosyltransferase involved in cell wall biosynthesis